MAQELAKAYIQIIPSAKGIGKGIENEIVPHSDKAGEKAGMSIASKIKGAIMAAGIGKALQATIMEGANLEQSIGGIETLFKDSADKVKKYANEAYKTAGLSANGYMEQVTSFSASLLQSLGGDTAKATESANQAIIDMADNSNKMGTAMESIQNAYQGFAKGNYTMLDNLKLGYGGTKEEMQRLLVEAEKISGVKYDIKNLDDVYSAIHVIQTELGITGTTAKEASSTISGSFSAMKSAFSNLLGDMALGNSIKPSLDALLQTTSTFLLGNLLPMVKNVFLSIPPILMEIVPQFVEQGYNMLNSFTQGFVQGFPLVMGKALELVQNFATWIASQAPIIINKGFEMLSNLVAGIVNALPVMIQKIPVIISTFANIINDNMPTILKKGFDLLVQLIKGIISAIPTLIQNIPQIIRAIVDTLMAFEWLSLGKNIINLFTKGIKGAVGFVKQAGKEVFDAIHNSVKNLPQTLMTLGKNAISFMKSGISSMVSSVGSAMKNVGQTIVKAVKSIPSQMLSIGKNIVQGIWNGISGMATWLYNKVAGFAKNIVNKVKNAFKIHSPSKVFELEVGKMLPLGMAVGIEKNIKPVDDAIAKMNNATMGVIDTNVNATSRNYTSVSVENSNLLSVIVELLKIIVDKDDKDDDKNVLDRILMILSDILPQLLERQLVLDNGVVAGELAPLIDEKLGRLRNRKGR